MGFRLNRQGAIVFARFTGENIGRRIAIVLDEKVRSAPVVQGKIPGGEGRITGLDSDDEANDLAIVLRAGALARAGQDRRGARRWARRWAATPWKPAPTRR